MLHWLFDRSLNRRTIIKLDFVKKPEFESILTNPILDIAARFWEEDRYAAFRTCYRSMRIIDDLVDDRKASGGPISSAEARQYEAMIHDWVSGIRRGRPSDDFQKELLGVIDRYVIPTWPWERLAGAMIYDLQHDSFPTFLTFRRYSEGAAIAPATIFMHLCGIQRRDGRFDPPPFDALRAARPLAIFSYLTHIVRDFQKDHQRHLNYFPLDLMAQCGVKAEQLHRAATGGPIPDGLREIISRYLDWIDYYRNRSLRELASIRIHLLPQYQLSLAIIYGLYQQIVDRIQPESGSFTGSELNPPPAEIRERINQIIAEQQDKILDG